jgi:short-subunit dehydrogenase
MSSWALVTGATVGIGESFTRLLASHKYNIVLVARDLPKLNERAESLEATYGVKTQVVQADLATDSGCAAVEKFIANNEIEVLINNAGFGINKAFTVSDLDVVVATSWNETQKGKAVSIPGWQYKTLIFVMTTLPRAIVRKVGMNLRKKQPK